jgi:hypothetical protein
MLTPVIGAGHGRTADREPVRAARRGPAAWVPGLCGEIGNEANVPLLPPLFPAISPSRYNGHKPNWKRGAESGISPELGRLRRQRSMGTTLTEHDGKDFAAESAASASRVGYRWRTRMDLWVSQFRHAFIAYRAMKPAFRKSQLRGLPFSSWNRLFRALRCYSAVLDDVAVAAWEHTTALPANEHGLGFHQTYALEHTCRADPELRKRGLIWKDADRNLLIAWYQMVRSVGDKPSDPVPNEWSRVPDSIRLSRTQTERCKNTISGRSFVGETWVSRHFDLTHFDSCSFKDCDFSNVSFAASVFTRCSFSNVLMVNARLAGTVFSECELAIVDLSGAILENARLWYWNRFSGIRIDPFTRIIFPLLEECELSYELESTEFQPVSQP